MTWELIQEDTFYKEEVTYKDSYFQRGVFYESVEEAINVPFLGTDEPYKDGQESMMLASGMMSTDARILHTSEELLTYDATGDITTADKVYLKDPDVSRNKPQRYVVMKKEDWYVNSGFELIGTDHANIYLLVKEEKVVGDA